MKKRHTEEQIITILREAEAGNVPITTLCKGHNISEQTFFRWRNKFGGMDVPDARRLKDLELENARLKRLVAEQMRVIDGMKEFSRKNDDPARPARCSAIVDLPGYLTAQGMRLLGLEPAHCRLRIAPAGEGSEFERTPVGHLAACAALWLSAHGGMAGRGPSPRASAVACNWA